MENKKKENLVETKKRDREFQLRIFEIERLTTFAYSFFFVMIAVLFSLWVTSLTLYYSASVKLAWIIPLTIVDLIILGVFMVLLMLVFYWTGRLINKLRKEFIES